MKSGRLSVFALSILLFAACSDRSTGLMSDAGPMDVIDLAKVPDRKENARWTGGAVEDIVDIAQVAHFILVGSCSSAPPEVLLVRMIDLLSAEGAVFEEDPPDWDPQALPTIDALLVLQNGDVHRITKWRDWVRITSAQGHGSVRWSWDDMTASFSNPEGMSVKDMNDLARQIGVDLTCRPNLKRNRLWREGPVSGALKRDDIAKIVVYQSTTREPLESDLKKVLAFIELGRAIEPEQHGMNPVQMRADVPLVSALVITKSKAYYRIVIRESDAQITSVAGHGYFTVARKPD